MAQIFVSYSKSYIASVRHLRRALQDRGFAVWTDEIWLAPSKKWNPRNLTLMVSVTLIVMAVGLLGLNTAYNAPTPFNSSILLIAQQSSTTTSSPVATNAIAPTVTPTATIPSDFTYTFDDPAFDGRYDTARLGIFDTAPQCKYLQQDGVLVFDNTESKQGLNCVLAPIYPRRILRFQELGIFEGRLKLSRKISGGIQFAIVISDSDLTKWEAYCGFHGNGSDNATAFFQVFDKVSKNPDYSISFVRSYDRWYTFRLEVDTNTSRVSCYIDGRRMGYYVPKTAETSKPAALFKYAIQDYRAPRALGPAYVDNFHIVLSSAMTTPTPQP